MNTFRRFIYGIVLKPVTSDPTDNVEGSLWVNSTSNRLKGYVQAAVREMVTTDQTQTLTNKTLTGATITVSDSGFTVQDNGDATKQAKFEASGITTATTRTFTFPDANTTIVGTDATQTLTNKTLTDSTTFIQDEADNSKKLQLQLSGITTATTRTLTIPDANTTIVGHNATQTLSNKTLDNSNIITVQDSNLTIQDNTDNTKQVKLEASGVTTGTTRTLTVPDANVTIVGHNNTQTLSNKTLDNSNVATLQDSNLTIQDNGDNTKQLKFEASGITTGTTRTLTAPDANTTIVGHDATQTLSNKTLNNTNTITVQDSNLTIQDNGDNTKQLQLQVSGVTTGTTRTLTVPDANTTIVGTDAIQTLTNKSLTGPVITDFVDYTEQGSSPATPASGKTRVYSKSDNFLYYKTDAGAEVKLQAGSGGINYISNPDAEGGTTGWVVYDDNDIDGATTRPFNGTGGTAEAVSFAASATNPLRGTQSFVLSKSGVSGQGEGVSNDFTIDLADRSKVLNISFDYTIASGTYSGGTSSTDSDLIVYIYDVANTRLIEPAPFKLDGAVVGTQYKYTGTFQAASNSSSYRLILHVATTSISAYDFKFDNVQVGPEIIVNGTPVTDLLSYTPALTASAGTPSIGNGTIAGTYRKIGDSIEGIIKFVAGSTTTFGTAGATLRFGLPSALSVDESKLIPTSNANNTVVGNASILQSGVASFLAETVYGTGSNTYVMLNFYSAASASVEINDLVHNNNVFDWTTTPSGDTAYITFKVPILGWSSNVQMSSDTDTRVVALSATGDAASATAGNPIIFPTKTYDTHAGYNASTGRYAVPVSGYYRIHGHINSAEVDTIISVYVNAVERQRLGETDSTGEATYTGTVLVNSGDLIDIRPSGTLDAGATSTYHIERLSGPSQIAASDSINLQVQKTSGSHTATGSEQDVTSWDAVTFDSHGQFNSTTGIYVFNSPGIYSIKAHICLAPNATGSRYALIQKNGAGTLAIGAEVLGSASVAGCSDINGDFKFVSGDTLRVRAFQNSGGNLAYGTTAGQNILSIHRVGN